MVDLFSELNSAQKQAVAETEGFVRVIAGAGSGKTRTLTHRYAYLVNELGILPANILCVTFSNKAANEMRRRIHNLTGDNDTSYICTFHSFCVSILQEDSFAVGYPKNFLVLDNSDIDSMLKIIYEERGLTLRDMTFGNARDMIEIRKLFKDPEYYLDLIEKSVDELREMYLAATSTSDIIFYGYMYQAKKCFGLDYNDLIIFSLHIFKINEQIRLKWQTRLEYIMIDEFQDIDELQYELMEALCDYHKNLFIVGDPDQTIYTWRGANVKYLLEFDKTHQNTKTIMMNENYRSTPQVIAAANSLISRNKQRIKKELVPILPDGKTVVCHHAQNEKEEAAWMAQEITKLTDEGVKLKDIAILYRSHYLTRSIEEVFQSIKLPYAIYSGVPFFSRAEIKDALSYLRMVACRDDLSFMRIVNNPKRNMGKRRMEFLKEYAEKNDCTLYNALVNTLDDEIFKSTKASAFVSLIEKYTLLSEEVPVSELLARILDEGGYENALRTEGDQHRLDNLAELKQSVYEYETTCGEECSLVHYLSHIALFTGSDTEFAEDKVKLMTIHTAKGLEFPYVFMCSLNEGVFPTKKTNTLTKMEEERRLCFVGMTRAQKRLYISESEGRNLDGSPRYPSRFVLDVDSELLDYTQPPMDGLIKDAKDYIRSSEKYMPESFDSLIFPDGTRVYHSIFGVGTVLSSDTEKGAHIVKFDKIDTPRSISFKAKLSKLTQDSPEER